MRNINALADEFAEAIWAGTNRVELTSTLEQLLSQKGFSVESAIVIDNFDKLKKLVFTSLARKINDAAKGGLNPRYAFADFDADYLLPLATVEEDEIRQKVTGALQAMSWRAFERLCAAVLTVDGVRSATARGSKEEGIDIFGLVQLPELSGSSFWQGVTLRIAGQSKKGKITEPMVRLFANDLDSLRHGHGRGFTQSPAWFRSSPSPILGIMFSSSTVAVTAKSWAEKKGVTVKNGRQIVEALLKAKSPVQGFNHVRGQLEFDIDKFSRYFEEK